MEQLTVWDVLEDIENDIENLSDIEILHKLELETGLCFKNKKNWKCGITDYFIDYNKTRISIHFSRNKTDNHKIICVEADKIKHGIGVPCNSLKEAIDTIIQLKEWAKDEILNTYIR